MVEVLQPWCEGRQDWIGHEIGDCCKTSFLSSSGLLINHPTKGMLTGYQRKTPKIFLSSLSTCCLPSPEVRRGWRSHCSGIAAMQQEGLLGVKNISWIVATLFFLASSCVFSGDSGGRSLASEQHRFHWRLVGVYLPNLIYGLHLFPRRIWFPPFYFIHEHERDWPNFVAAEFEPDTLSKREFATGLVQDQCNVPSTDL